MNLDTKEAVKLAKDWVGKFFADEGVADIGLEEVRFHRGVWEITIGFSRSWDVASVAGSSLGLQRPRSYKVVLVSDAEKSVVGARIREAA
jgi:hypothetical protein